MKMYLASAAPGNDCKERECYPIPRRLLSYYHILEKKFDIHHVLRHIIKRMK